MAKFVLEDSRSEEAGRSALVKILSVWIVVSIIGMALVWFVLGPHLAPGTMTDQAQGAQFDIKFVSTLVVPVLLFVWFFFGYSIMKWRVRPGEDGTLPAANISGNSKAQGAWYIITTTLVLGLAAFGTYFLIAPAGAGGGEGASPIWTPGTTKLLQVQVIAQQWRFTYRWPQFGGMETTGIELPVNTEIQFNVTSLDVIHDFWAYQLGVKADANPDYNNVAFTKTLATGNFTVRCDELCGIWHGAMFNYGKVVSQQQFEQWATNMEQQNAPVTKLLPKYSLTYTPSYSGAGGGYYNTNVDPNANL
ncbi:MAG: cytochrome c oxidase subunit II [Actinomycetota bacterium]|nr:cytochrome c oxidase subunit II [Actinomycetota bacterium]